MHLAQAQNELATVEWAAHRSGVFSTTFLLNESDEKQLSGRITAVGRWFESGDAFESEQTLSTRFQKLPTQLNTLNRFVPELL